MDHVACGLFMMAQGLFELLDGPYDMWFVNSNS
jgi:hypothetical protein